MEWTNLLSAVLAGGLAGQITTLLLGQRLQRSREKLSWLRTERFKAFSDLLALVFAYASREDFSSWPDDIRVACQRVHLLAGPEGMAPAALSDNMQRIFDLALDRKLNRVADMKVWRDEMRKKSSELRRDLATILHS